MHTDFGRLLNEFDRGRLTIAPSAPRVRGSRGVRILFTTKPGTAFFNPRRAPAVADGALVRVRGRTVPRLPHQTVRLAALPPGAWQVAQIQEGGKGPLVAEVAFVRAVATRDGLPGRRCVRG